jgi:hypothetical protein
MIRFTGSLPRRGLTGTGRKKGLLQKRKGLLIKGGHSSSNHNVHSVVPVLDRREDFEKTTFELGLRFFRDDLMNQCKAAGIFCILASGG